MARPIHTVPTGLSPVPPSGPATPLVGVKAGAGKGKPNEIDTITGATISSKVVIDIINHGLEEWQPVIDKGIPQAPTDSVEEVKQ